MQPTNIAVGRLTTLSKNIFTIEGFTFKGWTETPSKYYKYSETNVNVKYEDQGTYLINSDVCELKIYAVWQRTENDGGTYQGDGVKYQSDEKIINPATPSLSMLDNGSTDLEGNEFSHYIIASRSDGRILYNESQFSEDILLTKIYGNEVPSEIYMGVKIPASNDVTLQRVYKNTYTIVFNENVPTGMNSSDIHFDGIKDDDLTIYANDRKKFIENSNIWMRGYELTSITGQDGTEYSKGDIIRLYVDSDINNTSNVKSLTRDSLFTKTITLDLNWSKRGETHTVDENFENKKPIIKKKMKKIKMM